MLLFQQFGDSGDKITVGFQEFLDDTAEKKIPVAAFLYKSLVADFKYSSFGTFQTKIGVDGGEVIQKQIGAALGRNIQGQAGDGQASFPFHFFIQKSAVRENLKSQTCGPATDFQPLDRQLKILVPILAFSKSVEGIRF